MNFDLDRTGIANMNVLIYAGSSPSFGGASLITTITNPASGAVSYSFTPSGTQQYVFVYFKKLSTENKTFYIDNLKIQTVATSPYAAVTVMTSDYYPFGMQMPGRHTDDPRYRYGYNGMEKDAEMHGEGNSYTTNFRQYDPRLGRWLSIDPLMGMFPWMSPYVAFDNNPVFFTDPLGLAAEGGPDGPTAASKGLPSNPENGKNYKTNDGQWYRYDNGWSATIGDEPARKANVWVAKDYQLVSHQGDNTTVTLPRELTMTIEERDAEAASWKPREVTMRDGRDDRIKFAEDMARRYDIVLDNAIPGWELAQRLAAGDKITGTEVFIEGLGVFPAGRLFTRGGRLFVRSLKKGDDAIDITKRSVSACFIKGTKISTEDGLKDIENIQVGDSVWAFDEQTQTNVLKPVLDTMILQSDHLLKLVFDNNTLYTTNDHPFFLNGSWVEAKNLNIGDSLHLFNNTRTVIQHKERIDTLVTVYNLEVADAHNYYVGEDQILVHNKPKPKRKIPVANVGPGKLLQKDLKAVKAGDIRSHDIYQGIENPGWAGAEEFVTPNSPAGSGWRILKQTLDDGTVRYGWTKDHYGHIKEF